jgi:hypothetical protein
MALHPEPRLRATCGRRAQKTKKEKAKEKAKKAKEKAKKEKAKEKMCEGCRLKQATYGLASEGKKRWCAGCGKARKGGKASITEEPTVAEMQAELRRLKLPTGGSKKELRTRLRGLGAEQLLDFRERTMAARVEKGTAEEAVPLLKQKMCEGCGLKRANYELASEGKARWCAGCGKAKGAVNIQVLKKRQAAWVNGLGQQLAIADSQLIDDNATGPYAQAAGEGERRTQARGSPPQKLEAADPPLTISDVLNLCSGSKDRLAVGNLHDAAPLCRDSDSYSVPLCLRRQCDRPPRPGRGLDKGSLKKQGWERGGERSGAPTAGRGAGSGAGRQRGGLGGAAGQAGGL